MSVEVRITCLTRDLLLTLIQVSIFDFRKFHEGETAVLRVISESTHPMIASGSLFVRSMPRMLLSADAWQWSIALKLTLAAREKAVHLPPKSERSCPRDNPVKRGPRNLCDLRLGFNCVQSCPSSSPYPDRLLFDILQKWLLDS
jgi:hypothetical protein